MLYSLPQRKGCSVEQIRTCAQPETVAADSFCCKLVGEGVNGLSPVVAVRGLPIQVGKHGAPRALFVQLDAVEIQFALFQREAVLICVVNAFLQRPFFLCVGDHGEYREDRRQKNS